ncbi:MAG: glycosyltransferase family 4 protein [Tepidisphaeraceae bacterium]
MTTSMTSGSTMQTAPRGTAEADPRPAVAIISNSQTPYRLALHRRIAREMSDQIRLFSVYTHETSNAPWAFDAPPEIGPVMFGAGEPSSAQSDPRRAPTEWRKGGRVIRWMRENDIRAVVIGGYNDAGRLRIIRWCRRAGVPCFLFGDSNIRDQRGTHSRAKAMLKRAIVGRVVKWCAGVMPCGRLGMEYFAHYGAQAPRMFLFPYEPDYAMSQGLSPARVDEVARRFGLRDGRRRIVFSGRLAPVKRVDLLIDAFVTIAPQRQGWDLLIVGDGPLRAALERRVPAELRGRVMWTGFIDDQQTVTALYRASDVLVLPSDREPWAVVINEAAGAGLAIVASDVVGAAAELVQDGVNGRVFPAGDGRALTDALLDVTDPARIDAMKAASAPVLDDWRRRGDPVQGLRRALRFAGVI